MASVNKVILVGTTGKDAEVRYMADGGAVANISLATNYTWKDKATGERKQDTEWHRIVLYGRLAEVAGEYVRKGKDLYIEGRLKTRKWTDNQGIDRYTTEIIGDQMQLLGRKDDSQQSDGGFEQQPQRQQQSQQRQSAGGGHRAAAPTSVADLDDDIPFNQLPARYDI